MVRQSSIYKILELLVPYMISSISFLFPSLLQDLSKLTSNCLSKESLLLLLVETPLLYKVCPWMSITAIFYQLSHQGYVGFCDLLERNVGQNRDPRDIRNLLTFTEMKHQPLMIMRLVIHCT